MARQSLPDEDRNADPVQRTTLLELVVRLCREGEDEEATLRIVSQLLRSGRVELTGNFRDVPVEKLLAA